MVSRHVRKDEQRIAQQRALIAHLKASDLPIAQAETDIQEANHSASSVAELNGSGFRKLALCEGLLPGVETTTAPHPTRTSIRATARTGRRMVGDPTQQSTQHARKAKFLHPVPHDGQNGREGDDTMTAIIARLLITVSVMSAIACAPMLAPAAVARVGVAAR